MKIEVPSDFRDYLQRGNSTAGFLDTKDFERYFDLCPESELEEWNRDYEVESHAPGFTVFGTNGGGELYAFGIDGAVYELPEIGLAPDVASRIFDSWAAFVAYIKPAA